MQTIKQMLTEICEDALVVPFCTRVTRTVEGIRISFHRTDFTDGIWIVCFPDGEELKTNSIFEVEIKLGEALAKVEGVS